MDRYFEPKLARLIWNDAIRSKGEVGALEADPLFETQETPRISDFNVRPAVYKRGKATVSVTFMSLGHRKAILYSLVPSAGRWKIANIDYLDGENLVKILKSG